jgi:NitT/TauT family transport system substrate-binding protein
MRLRVLGLVLGIVLLAYAGDGAAEPRKVTLGVLKLTSSAVLFLGVEKGYFKEFGIDPELVYFQAAQPIAVALASGDLDIGATGLTAGFYNVAAGGVKVWVVADKGREWPDHNLTAILVRRDLHEAGVRTLRDLRGKKIGVTQIGSTFHYNVGRLLEKEGLKVSDVELVPLQALTALSDALAARRVDAVVTAEPFVSRIETTGTGVTITRVGDSLPWQSAVVMYSDRFAQARARAVAFMKGYIKSSRHYFDAVIKQRSGPEYDEVVAITARYTGAGADLIRKGFPYQDRDGRLMPGDVGQQLRWWIGQKLVRRPLTEREVVDETFLRDALQGLN